MLMNLPIKHPGHKQRHQEGAQRTQLIIYSPIMTADSNPELYSQDEDGPFAFRFSVTETASSIHLMALW